MQNCVGIRQYQYRFNYKDIRSKMDSTRKPYTFDRVVRILFSVCLIIGVLFLLNILKGVLLPFLVACLIAYMLEPLVLWNKRILRMHHRFIPVALTLLEVCVVIGGLAMIVIPYIVGEATQMAELLRSYAASQIRIPFLPSNVHEFLRENIDFDYISRLLTREEWAALAKNALSTSWSFLSSGLAIIFAIISWLIVLLYVVFIMVDYERLMLSFRQLVPHDHRRRVFHIFDDIKNAMNRYFRGQFVIAMLVGVLFAIGFALIGLPMGIVLGLFVGVLNLVPYLQLISLPIAVILCLVGAVGGEHDFWVLFWETMAVYVVVQAIQDLILTPKIMGKAMGLNPAIILLSLSIWGCLLGFMGLIVALPLTTLILSYYDMYVLQRMHRDSERRSFQKNIEEINDTL